MSVSNQLMQIFTKVLRLRLKESSLLTDLYIIRKIVPEFRHRMSKRAFTIKKKTVLGRQGSSRRERLEERRFRARQ